MRRFLFVTILITICGCSSDKSEVIYTNGAFELQISNDWRLINSDGFDSYVGYYYRQQDTIVFDYGFYGFGDLEEIVPQVNTFYFEETLIDGCPSKIVGSSFGASESLTAYIVKADYPDMKNILNIKNPSNKEEIITIFKSHKFK